MLISDQLQQAGLIEHITTITLDGEPISPVNAYSARAIRTKYGKWTAMVYLNSKFIQYKKAITKAAKATYKGEVFTGPVLVETHFYFGTRRRKDLPNAGKLEFDALNDIVYADDSQICLEIKHKHFDKERPRIEIKVFKYPGADFPITETVL